MMVFGGGSSPMSFAGWASEPAPQPFLRDRSTSVPSGLRFPPSQRRKFRSGSGLLCPLIVRARFPDRQHQDCDLARCCDCGLSEPASSGQSHSPALQWRETLHLADQAGRCLEQQSAHRPVSALRHPSRPIHFARCRSDPQIAVEVTRITTSVVSSMVGSSTVSTWTLPVP